MPKQILRIVVYLLCSALLAQFLFLEVTQLEPDKRFTEFGYVEWMQSLLLLATVLLFAVKAVKTRPWRQLSVCLAVFFLLLLIRENDKFLDLLIFQGAWKYIALFPAVGCMIYFWRNRVKVMEQLRVFMRTPAFGIMLGGFLVLVYSRLFGRASYWEALMGENYLRLVKNAAEEGLELVVLGLFLVAAFEFLVTATPKNHSTI